MKGDHVTIELQTETQCGGLMWDSDSGFVWRENSDGIGVCDTPWSKNCERFPNLFTRLSDIRFYPWHRVMRVNVKPSGGDACQQLR